jgi:hypothetical protein
MTTQTQNPTTLHFHVAKHAWKDVFVVASLAIVLGSFVAQISSTPEHARTSPPVAAVCTNSAAC